MGCFTKRKSSCKRSRSTYVVIVNNFWSLELLYQRFKKCCAHLHVQTLQFNRQLHPNYYHYVFFFFFFSTVENGNHNNKLIFFPKCCSPPKQPSLSLLKGVCTGSQRIEIWDMPPKGSGVLKYEYEYFQAERMRETERRKSAVRCAEAKIQWN